MSDINKTKIEKLLELKKLYENGILTKEEMEAEKQKILGTTTPPPKQSIPHETKEPVKEIETYDNITAIDSEFEEDEEESFFKRNKVLIILCIVAGVIGIYFLFSKVILPLSDADKEHETLAIERNREPIAIKGKINGKIGFTMRLKFNGREIEGTEHYDSQKADAILSVKGSIDNEGFMTLREFDGNNEAGLYKGNLSANSFEGTFTNTKNTVFPFYADVMSEKEMQAREKDQEKAVEKIERIGTVITCLDGKVYYLNKDYSEGRYDSQGDDSGKIFVYDISSESTTQIPIHIPSEELYSIDNWQCKDQKITFVLYDVGRNGFGIGNYCTEVSQYNIKTGKWKDIAEGCASAEFIENGKKIKITWASITNYDEATAAFEYEYAYTEEIIEL